MPNENGQWFFEILLEQNGGKARAPHSLFYATKLEETLMKVAIEKGLDGLKLI